MNHRIGLSLATLLFTSLTLASGCVSHRVSAMVYTEHNPYAPHGVLYESWEQKREIDGILNDTRITHTAIGAAGGAITGQAIGRNTKNTLWGTGIGAVAGLTHGSVSDHNRKIAHEDHMTRLANDWQIHHNQEIQDRRDVTLGATITHEQYQRRLNRLEAARAALAQRDKDAEMARQMREMDDEIERLNATTVSH